MSGLPLRTRIEIVGWEVAAVGALWAVLQLLALLYAPSIPIIERFTVYGGAGVVGLALILVGMEILALGRRVDRVGDRAE